MNNVLGFLEAKLMPLAAKTAQQRHLGAIRGAYVSFMPFIIVGSIRELERNYRNPVQRGIFHNVAVYQLPGGLPSGGALRR